MPEDDDPTSAIGRGWKSTFLANDRGDLYSIKVYNHQHFLSSSSSSTNPISLFKTCFEIILILLRNGRKGITFFRINMGMARRW